LHHHNLYFTTIKTFYRKGRKVPQRKPEKNLARKPFPLILIYLCVPLRHCDVQDAQMPQAHGSAGAAGECL